MSATPRLTILNDDCVKALKSLPDNSVQCCVTSPPYYGLRSYLKADDPSKDEEIGNEESPQEYVERLVEVFREVKRVLKEDGVLWLNLGDSYVANKGMGHGGRHDKVDDTWGGNGMDKRKTSGLKLKDLLMIPARVAMALQADGWYLRAACPWIKRNGMPESVKDRPSQTIEMVYMLTKSERYHYNAESVKLEAKKGSAGSRFDTGKTAEHQQNRSSTKPRTETGLRTRRSGDWFFESWQGLLQNEEGDPLAFVVNTKPYKGAHFACFPPDLIRPCVKACARQGDTVLDPFGGSGTTAQVALENGSYAIVCELNAEYVPLIKKRCENFATNE